METTQPEASIAPRALYELLAGSGATELLDVRSPAEYAAAHVAGAKLVPLDRLDAAAVLKQGRPRGKSIYVLCQSGGRARQAIGKFQRAGFDGCVLVEGGLQAWIDASLPVVRGAVGTLPLMRQVQIIAGFMSASGAALGFAVHPAFAVIPLLIGCGLFFAGLTGRCGLALLLARMPWNQTSTDGAGSCCGTGPEKT